jgi:hypothetical protein
MVVTRASSASANSSFQGDHLCEICTCKFDTPSKLQSHLLLKHEFPIATNSSSGPLLTALVCPVCDESFSRAEHLLAHTAVHGQAAKIYKCTHCPLAFVFKSQLINHSFAHQNSNNHQQPTTPNSQNKSYNLRSHISPRSLGPSPQFNSTSNNQRSNNGQNVSITKIAPQLTQVQSVNRMTAPHSEDELNEMNDDNDYDNYNNNNNNPEENEGSMYPDTEEANGQNDNKMNERDGSNIDEPTIGIDDEEHFVDENENFHSDQNEFTPIDDNLPQDNENNDVMSNDNIEEDMQENLEEASTKSDSVAPNSNKDNCELSEETIKTNENFNDENDEQDFIVNENDEIENVNC